MKLDRLTAADLPVDIGRYRLLDILGRGGMAAVFHAEMRGRSGFSKEVALKVILSEIAEAHEFAFNAFVNEARVGGRLHHPNVVQTWDFDDLEGQPAIAMELVRGQDLSGLIPDGGLPPEVVVAIASQACRGLQHAHDLTADGEPVGLVHRDLKPSNFLLSEEGVVKLSDFGLAKGLRLTENRTRTGHAKGTATYMAPEQATGAPVDRRTDLFAMGLILFELATGRRFFEPMSLPQLLFQIVQIEARLEDPTHLAPADAALPGLAAVIHSCLRRDPNQRYVDANALRLAIEGLGVRPADLRTWLRSAPVAPAAAPRTPAFTADTEELPLSDEGMPTREPSDPVRNPASEGPQPVPPTALMHDFGRAARASEASEVEATQALTTAPRTASEPGGKGTAASWVVGVLCLGLLGALVALWPDSGGGPSEEGPAPSEPEAAVTNPEPTPTLEWGLPDTGPDRESSPPEPGVSTTETSPTPGAEEPTGRATPRRTRPPEATPPPVQRASRGPGADDTSLGAEPTESDPEPATSAEGPELIPTAPAEPEAQPPEPPVIRSATAQQTGRRGRMVEIALVTTLECTGDCVASAAVRQGTSWRPVALTGGATRQGSVSTPRPEDGVLQWYVTVEGPGGQTSFGSRDHPRNLVLR